MFCKLLKVGFRALQISLISSASVGDFFVIMPGNTNHLGRRLVSKDISGLINQQSIYGILPLAPQPPGQSHGRTRGRERRGSGKPVQLHPLGGYQLTLRLAIA